MKRQVRVPTILAEPLAVLAGMLGATLGKDSSSSSARTRGWLLSPISGDRHLSIGPNVEIMGYERVTLGCYVTLFGNTYLNAKGENGRIEIGDRTHIDQFCVLYGQGGLKIGARCAIASGVIIYSQTNQYAADPERDIIDQPVIYAAVTIGDDVWIGAQTVILPGVRVGDHAVIAAGAVVRHDIAPWTVVGGVPAKVIGDRRIRKIKVQ